MPDPATSDPTPPADAHELLERLRRLEEAESARHHVFRYATTLDDPAPEAVAALFTTDGALSVAAGQWQGREGVAAFFRDRLADDPSEKRHFVVNPITRPLGPGLVEVRSHFLYTARADLRSALGWGRYVDRVRITGGVALFESKTITLDVGTDLDRGWAAG